MLHVLNSLASVQSKGAEEIKEAMAHFLNYCTTHPDATVRFHSSDMILKINSDASYLSEKGVRSRAEGYYFLDNKDDPMKNNGAIHVVARMLKNVMSSAAEAEIVAVFMNAKEAVPIRQNLEELGHPQPATEIITDNKAAHGILNQTCKQTRSKAIDMNYYWVRDSIEQGQFKSTWKKGTDNLANYFTKHHSPAHCKRMKPIYLQLIQQQWASMAKIDNLREFIDRHRQTPTENRQIPKVRNKLAPRSLKENSKRKFSEGLKCLVIGQKVRLIGRCKLAKYN